MPNDYGRVFDEIQSAKQLEGARHAAEQQRAVEQQRLVDIQAGLELAKKMLDAIVQEKKISFSILDGDATRYDGLHQADHYTAYAYDSESSDATFAYDGQEYIAPHRKRLQSVKYRTCADEMNRQLRPSGLQVHLRVCRKDNNHPRPFDYSFGNTTHSDGWRYGSFWEFTVMKIPLPPLSAPSQQPPPDQSKQKSKLPVVAMVIGLVSFAWLIYIASVASDLVNTGGEAAVALGLSLILGALAFILGIAGLIKHKNKICSAVGVLSGLAPWVIVLSQVKAAW